MEVSELMIGNAVQYNGTPFKVTDISRAWPRVNDRYNNKPVVTIFDGGIFTVGLDEISPIPITEEFLKKNGFERDEFVFDISNKAIYNLKKDEFSILIYKGANKGAWYYQAHVDDKCGCTIGNADILYVHQLQNLLNLLEIEWEVKI